MSVVEFDGDRLTTVYDGATVRVAMRHVCEALGLDWKSQHRKITTDRVLSASVVIMTTEGGRGQRDMLTLPVEMMHGWLFTVRIPPHHPAFEKLTAYQCESYAVLHDYWVKGAAINPRVQQVERTSATRDLIALLDKLERTNNGEVRRVLHELTVRRCADLDIAPPHLDRIGHERPDTRALADRFFAAVGALIEAGEPINHHRKPSLIAVRMVDLAALGVRVDDATRAAVREDARFVMTGPVNSAQGKFVHCWVFRRDAAPD